MTRVLVTGAGGYIGSTLTPLLLDAGYAVRAVDRFFFGRHLVGSADKLYRIGPLGELVARYVPRAVEIEWYGDPQGVAWDDPKPEIPWPLDTAVAILSLKDRDLPRLADIDSPFFCQPDAAHATS